MASACVTGPKVGQIRRSIVEKYRAVARRPSGHFAYPVGRESALRLGYEPEWLKGVPAPVLRRFVGVGNPIRIVKPRPGESILDLGCGSGLDAWIAASLVGPAGRVIGLDLTPEMFAGAAQAARRRGMRSLRFRRGNIEKLPFEDAAFDRVLSNGVMNLVPDKEAAFREVFRVLRTGGVFAAADLLVTARIPGKVLRRMDAWSTWIAGALPGRACLALLRKAGFRRAKILGRTGYSTSRFTEAFHLLAVK